MSHDVGHHCRLTNWHFETLLDVRVVSNNADYMKVSIVTTCHQKMLLVPTPKCFKAPLNVFVDTWIKLNKVVRGRKEEKNKSIHKLMAVAYSDGSIKIYELLQHPYCGTLKEVKPIS
ncbi:Tn554-related [Striga asiatica]|uniref:Tn554-related n=1 Tax=Striga asiatica TaxID=4170 RepID=A0A5A7NXS0_STRAF|nr:Tn554-related [Striga asiatica]